MRIRPCNKDDWPKLSKMICETLESLQSDDYPRRVIDRMTSHFSQKGLSDLSKSRAIYVAYLYGQVVGTASLKGNLILSVFIKVAYQRKGLGTCLINHLEGIARENGHGVVKVPASTDSTDFYTKLGYLETDRVISDFGPNVIMSKSLLIT